MKKIALIAVTLMLVAASADAAVWRVRQNYTDAGKGGYNNMIDYVEPAAAAADAAFGGTASTWNSWDVDVRSGVMGGYNYVKGVRIGTNGTTSTLYDGTGLSSANNVTIGSVTNSGQHSPWYNLPTSGTGFEQLVGGNHSAGNNNHAANSTYTVQIGGLTAGEYVFYSYALRNAYSSGAGNYTLAINGGASQLINASLYGEGDAASGKLFNVTVGAGGTMDLVYSASAGLTGPAFQFANAIPEPATMSLLVLGGIATLIRRRNRRA